MTVLDAPMPPTKVEGTEQMFEAPKVPLIPIEGGAPCDRCGNRAFRKTQTGLHRHIQCESAAWAQDQIVRRYGRAPWRLGVVSTPKSDRGRCRGCCSCRG